MTLTLQGKTVSYMDSDPENAAGRPVVLFLHGWGAPVATYRLLLEHLAGYCRVVAPDLPGFGGSEEPAQPFCVDDYVEWTLAFASALQLQGQKLILMNHSFGGRISLKLLARRPLPLAVEKAVFLDAAGIRPRRTVKYYCKVYSYKAAKRLSRLPGAERLFPGLTERVRGRAGSADWQNASPLMRRTMTLCVNEDLTPLLPADPVPTLLIWGELDTATPLRDGRLMESRIPDAGLVVLPRAGHFAFAQQWGICSRALDAFLKPGNPT